MRFSLSPLVLEKLKRIKQKDKKLTKRIQKQLLIFDSNPQHPSLRLHKLTGKKENAWSISITMNIRMIYRTINADTVYFVDIGTHDEVYKK